MILKVVDFTAAFGSSLQSTRLLSTRRPPAQTLPMSPPLSP